MLYMANHKPFLLPVIYLLGLSTLIACIGKEASKDALDGGVDASEHSFQGGPSDRVYLDDETRLDASCEYRWAPDGPYSELDECSSRPYLTETVCPYHIRRVYWSSGGTTTRMWDRETFELIRYQKVKKGNVLETARIAGIMAAKNTSALIPMCHPLNITHVRVDFKPDPAHSCIGIEAAVRTIDQTGVEMEALTAVSVAALTIYDMCKSYDKEMTISKIQLLKKTGGKSGTFERIQS